MTTKTRQKTLKAVDLVKIEVSTEGAGEIAGVGPERIRQWTKEGWFEKLGSNRYSVAAVFAGVLAYKDDQIARLSRAGSSSKLQDARAAEIEVRTEERRQTHLIEAQAEAVAIIDEFAGQLRADIMAIPARVTADLRLRQKLEDEIDEAFGMAGDRAAAAAAMVDPPKPVSNRGARRAAVSGKHRLP